MRQLDAVQTHFQEAEFWGPRRRGSRKAVFHVTQMPIDATELDKDLVVKGPLLGCDLREPSSAFGRGSTPPSAQLYSLVVHGRLRQHAELTQQRWDRLKPRRDAAVKAYERHELFFLQPLAHATRDNVSGIVTFLEEAAERMKEDIELVDDLFCEQGWVFLFEADLVEREKALRAAIIATLPASEREKALDDDDVLLALVNKYNKEMHANPPFRV